VLKLLFLPHRRQTLEKVAAASAVPAAATPPLDLRASGAGRKSRVGERERGREREREKERERERERESLSPCRMDAIKGYLDCDRLIVPSVRTFVRPAIRSLCRRSKRT
jgi:hypothetical protein